MLPPDQINIFEGVSGMYSLLRNTKRKSITEFYVSSIAVISDDEKDINNFINMANKRGALIHSVEENQSWKTPIPRLPFVMAWKDARKNGAAKVGGKISADIRKKKSAEGIAKIKDRWPMPSKEWPTEILLKEAGVSLNTAKSVLGRRPIEQANYAAKIKRKAKRNLP